MDTEGIPDIAKLYPSCLLAGPTSVIKKLKELGISQERIIRLDKGMSETVEGFKLTATLADHSDEYSLSK